MQVGKHAGKHTIIVILPSWSEDILGLTPYFILLFINPVASLDIGGEIQMQENLSKNSTQYFKQEIK